MFPTEFKTKLASLETIAHHLVTCSDEDFLRKYEVPKKDKWETEFTIDTQERFPEL